jgi:biopolymer transport protein ExbD
MKADATSGLQRDPNVIPMLDILLVLIIAAILGLQQFTLDVQLPVAASAGVEPGVPLVLSIAKGPTCSLHGAAIPRERLIPELVEVFEVRPEKVLFIDGARDVSYQDVFYAYGAVRGASDATPPCPTKARRDERSLHAGSRAQLLRQPIHELESLVEGLHLDALVHPVRIGCVVEEP